MMNSSLCSPEKQIRARLALLEAKRRGLTVDTFTPAPPSLADFVERTTNFTLDPWQQHLCRVLEKVAQGQGARVLIHAPPQHGKSVVVSQRFPAWYLGQHPARRVRLACYNITHATRFGMIVRDLMRGNDYRAMFSNPGLKLPETAARGEWSTARRQQIADGQPSFMALGLVTGFVGQGADLLIIDDPYASPQDALSPVIRESVWTFWNESARVRLAPEANVVVMFHRYHEDDLAGRLWATGEFEMVRYAAVADNDPEWPDPLGRAEGERLSKRYSEQFYAEQEAAGAVWYGQFQGRPMPREGAMFKPGALKYAESAGEGQYRLDDGTLLQVKQSVRAWDCGYSRSGDYTVGARMGVTACGRYVLEDLVRGQWESARRNQEIVQTAERDGSNVRQLVPQEPAGGKDATDAIIRLLAGRPVTAYPQRSNKEVRADPFSAQVNVGNVVLVRAGWNRVFVDELGTFPLGRNDDQVDASAAAFNALAARRTVRVF